MSQSKKRKQQGGSAKSSGSAPRRASGSATPPVQRNVQQQTVRTRVDKALPPFTTQRYVAIWLLGLIPLVLLILVLARPGDTANTAGQGTQSTQTAQTSGGSTTATAGLTEMPVVTNPTGTTATGVGTAPGTGGTVAPAGADKYMIIETEKGRIVAKLYTEAAANVGKTIANFEQKANAGEFNGRIFHRVENWVIQGGDPTGTGSGGGDMPSEYNNITFKAGALGIARGQDPKINNDSQFFIVKQDSAFLDGQYTNWGQVIEGMDVVSKIAIGDKMTKVTISDKK